MRTSSSMPGLQLTSMQGAEKSPYMEGSTTRDLLLLLTLNEKEQQNKQKKARLNQRVAQPQQRSHPSLLRFETVCGSLDTANFFSAEEVPQLKAGPNEIAFLKAKRARMKKDATADPVASATIFAVNSPKDRPIRSNKPSSKTMSSDEIIHKFAMPGKIKIPPLVADPSLVDNGRYAKIKFLLASYLPFVEHRHHGQSPKLTHQRDINTYVLTNVLDGIMWSIYSENVKGRLMMESILTSFEQRAGLVTALGQDSKTSSLMFSYKKDLPSKLSTIVSFALLDQLIALKPEVANYSYHTSSVTSPASPHNLDLPRRLEDRPPKYFSFRPCLLLVRDGLLASVYSETKEKLELTGGNVVPACDGAFREPFFEIVARLEQDIQDLKRDNAKILENHDELIQQVSEDADVMGQIVSLFCCLNVEQKAAFLALIGDDWTKADVSLKLEDDQDMENYDEVWTTTFKALNSPEELYDVFLNAIPSLRSRNKAPSILSELREELTHHEILVDDKFCMEHLAHVQNFVGKYPNLFQIKNASLTSTALVATPSENESGTRGNRHVEMWENGENKSGEEENRSGIDSRAGVFGNESTEVLENGGNKYGEGNSPMTPKYGRDSRGNRPGEGDNELSRQRLESSESPQPEQPRSQQSSMRSRQNTPNSELQRPLSEGGGIGYTGGIISSRPHTVAAAEGAFLVAADNFNENGGSVAESTRAKSNWGKIKNANGRLAFFTRLSTKRMSVSQNALASPDMLKALQNKYNGDKDVCDDDADKDDENNEDDDADGDSSKRGVKSGKNGSRSGTGKRGGGGKVKKGQSSRDLHMFDTPVYWKQYLQGLLNKGDVRDIPARQLRHLIKDIYLEKAKADHVSFEKRAKKPLMDRYITEFFLFRFGTKRLVQDRLRSLLLSLKKCQKVDKPDPWVHTFGRFCGVLQPSLNQFALDMYVDVFANLSAITASRPQMTIGASQQKQLPAVECARADEFMLRTAKAMCWSTASLETAKDSVNQNARRKSLVSRDHVGVSTKQVSMVQVDDLMSAYLLQWEKEDCINTAKLKQLFKEFDSDNNGTLELGEFKELMKAAENTILKNNEGTSASPGLKDEELVSIFMDILDETAGEVITDEIFASIAKEKLYKILGANAMKNIATSTGTSTPQDNDEDEHANVLVTYSADEVDDILEMIASQPQQHTDSLVTIESLQTIIAPLLKHSF